MDEPAASSQPAGASGSPGISGTPGASITVGGVSYALDDSARVDHIPELESWAPLLNKQLPQALGLLSAMQGMQALSVGAGGSNSGGDGTQVATAGTPNAKKKKNKKKKRKNKNKAATSPGAPRQTLATLLDSVTYPHITDSIVTLLGRDAIPLRLVSRVLCTRVDRALLAHVYLNRNGTVDARGRRLPRTDYHYFEDIKGATRIMTIIESSQGPFMVDPARVSVLRMPAKGIVDWTDHTPTLATLVLFATAAPVHPAQWMLSSVLSLPPLSPSIRRIVYNVEFTYPPLLLTARLMWLDVPLTHVREVVFRITQAGPIPDKPNFVWVSNSDRAIPHYTFTNDDGPAAYSPLVDSPRRLVPVPEFVRDLAVEFTVFDMLATIFASEMHPDLHLTLVGLEVVNNGWWDHPEPLLPVVVNRILHVMTETVVATGASLEKARRDVEAAVDFMTESEYRSALGEEAWEMETNVDFPGFKVPPEVMPRRPRRS